MNSIKLCSKQIWSSTVKFLQLSSIANPKMSFEAEKEKYLSMSLKEKSKTFKSKIVPLDQVLTWPEYLEVNKLQKQKSDAETVPKKIAEKISLWEGDITTLGIDAIVNAANSSLLGGGGVDGAIHRAAGSFLKDECRTLNGCQVGEAKITGGYKLPAKYVIHTVGPQGEYPDKLKNCYQHSLEVARDNKVRTIAFPCISTGIYGYPQEPAANVALSTIKQFVQNHPDDIDRVIFCVFLKEDKNIYERLLQDYFNFA